MRIAVPLHDGLLSDHFGDSATVAFFDVHQTAKTILSRQDLPTPPHRPGVLPMWIAEQGAQVIIAGRMGERARVLFAHNGILVVAGASAQPPDRAVMDWLQNQLATNLQACGHDHHAGEHGCKDHGENAHDHHRNH
jgi:predicted Fe-Mo cluster-binding NifX family protein